MLTDEIVHVEGLVVGPEGVVNVGVPPEVGADDVVGGGGSGDEDGEEREDEDGSRHSNFFACSFFF